VILKSRLRGSINLTPSEPIQRRPSKGHCQRAYSGLLQCKTQRRERRVLLER
jgi:hypothetical protein